MSVNFSKSSCEENSLKTKGRSKLLPTETKQLYPSKRECFNISWPFFMKPIELGYFSRDIDWRFSDTRQALKFYIKPRNPSKVNFDLRKGYDSMIRKDETVKTYINSILEWINLHRDRLSVNQEKRMGEDEKLKRHLDTDFICWRGLLTKLLCSPYENKEDWQIAVISYNGTYYMCEIDTERKLKEEENWTEAQDEMCCWGWKFEQYLTADTADGTPDTDSQYNNVECFGTVVRSKLNNHSLVFAGEVDAVQKDEQGKESYVEFKTTREIQHRGHFVSFKRYKLLKWWAQSFLVGIPNIVSGYKDDDGVVHRLETFDVLKIPDMVTDIRDPWRPNVCLNFLDQFLGFVKDMVKTDNHRIVHMFQWNPCNEITCTKLPEDSEHCFLPDWYINPTEAESPKSAD